MTSTPTDPTMTPEDARQLQVLVDATDGQLSARYRRVLATYHALAAVQAEHARLRSDAQGFHDLCLTLTAERDALNLAFGKLTAENARLTAHTADLKENAAALYDELVATRASRDALALDAARERETLWRWCYALLLAGAKAELARENGELREAGTPNDWPAQQEWPELVGSSRALFLSRIRKVAGVDHDTFLAYVRGERGAECAAIAEDLYERADGSLDAARSAAPSTTGDPKNA